MFTWQELIGMGIRQKGYWLRQSEAVRRQAVANTAQSIGIALADKEDHQRAVDDLELYVTAKEARDKRSTHIWSMMKVFGRGGKGV